MEMREEERDVIGGWKYRGVGGEASLGDGKGALRVLLRRLVPADILKKTM